MEKTATAWLKNLKDVVLATVNFLHIFLLMSPHRPGENSDLLVLRAAVLARSHESMRLAVGDRVLFQRRTNVGK